MKNFLVSAALTAIYGICATGVGVVGAMAFSTSAMAQPPLCDDGFHPVMEPGPNGSHWVCEPDGGGNNGNSGPPHRDHTTPHRDGDHCTRSQWKESVNAYWVYSDGSTREYAGWLYCSRVAPWTFRWELN